MTIGAGSTLTFSSTQAAHGTLSYQVGAIASQFTFGNLAQTSSATTALRFYIYTGTVFSTATVIWQVLTTANANISQIQLNASGKLIFTQTAGIVATALTALSINTWYRVEATINTTSGAWTFAYYAGDSLTASESFSGTGTFTALPVNHRIGKASNGAQVATFFMDDLAVSDTATTFLGPVVTAVTGTLSASTPTITASISGTSTNAGTVAASTPVLTAALTGTSTNVGSMNAATPVLTFTESGQSANTGALSSKVPLLTFAETGASLNTGAVAAAVPVLTFSASGLSTNPGAVTSQLPLLTYTQTDTGTNVGSMNATLPLVIWAEAGQSVNAGTVTTKTPVLTFTQTGTCANIGVLAGAIPLLTFSEIGAATNLGALTARLPLITFTALASGLVVHSIYRGICGTPWAGSSSSSSYAGASGNPWAATSSTVPPSATSTTLWKGTSGE